MSAKIYDFALHCANSLNRNTEESIRSRHSFAQDVNTRKYSDGIDPSAFQLLTVGGPTPSCLATDEVPPNASMTASTDLSIPPNCSNVMNLSRLQDTDIDFISHECFDDRMDSNTIIGERLDIWLEAEGKKAVEVCRALGIAPNAFSQWRSGAQPLQLHAANAICNRYGLTLDWIYRGDMRGLPYELHNRISVIIEQRKNVRKF